jgi:dihydrofolate reductase
LLEDLKQRGYKELAICGGAQIYTMFMEAGVVDKVYFTIAPVVFGSGMSIFTKDIDVRFQLRSVSRLGKYTILVEHSVIREA